MKTQTAIDRFVAARIAVGVSSRTLEGYRYRLRKYAEWFTRLPKRPEQVELFLSQQGPSDETRPTYHRLLTAFYRWLKVRGLFKSNPMPRVAKPYVYRKVARALSHQELTALLTFQHHTSQVRALLWLLADTGVRLGEAFSVTQIDRHGGRFVVKSKTGERELPIHPAVARMVNAELPWPWANAHYAGLAVRIAFRNAGITGKRASAHTLRHTFARMWRGDESLLVEIMGWTSPRMLKVYKPYNIRAAITQHRVHSPLRQIGSSA